MKANISIDRGYQGKNKDNFTAVQINNLIVWFSYNTVIAFSKNGKLTIRENDWSTTTGKHLNWINDDHSIRVSSDVFEQKLSAALTPAA